MSSSDRRQMWVHAVAVAVAAFVLVVLFDHYALDDPWLDSVGEAAGVSTVVLGAVIGYRSRKLRGD